MRLKRLSSRRLARGAGPVLLEITLIVFSILLALGVDSCRERSARQALADTALANIRAEIGLNQTTLNRVLPGHRELHARLSEALTRLERGEDADPAVVFTPLNLVSAAWETAATTQALEVVDFQKVQLLARLYTGQRWIQRFDDAWMAATANPQNRLPAMRRVYLAALLSLVENYIGIEEELQRNFAAVLDRIGR